MIAFSTLYAIFNQEFIKMNEATSNELANNETPSPPTTITSTFYFDNIANLINETNNHVKCLGDCNVVCNGSNSCFFYDQGSNYRIMMTVDCADNHLCNVDCVGSMACFVITINGHASELSIFAVGDSCLGSSNILFGGSCSITVGGDNSLRPSTITGTDSSKTLSISSYGQQSLLGSNIICPRDTCSITANGFEATSFAVIDATQSSKLLISAGGENAMSDASITCPNTASLVPNCILKLMANSTVNKAAYSGVASDMKPITIYPNSDLIFLCDPLDHGIIHSHYFNDMPPKIKYSNGSIACNKTSFDRFMTFSCADPPSFEFKNAKCLKMLPTSFPSASPSNMPSNSPTSDPSQTPSNEPSNSPTNELSDSPINEPTDSPSSLPTQQPSSEDPLIDEYTQYLATALVIVLSIVCWAEIRNERADRVENA